MKSKDRWVRNKTSVVNIGYHIIWCPKYRRKVLTNGVDERLKELLYNKSKELDCKIEEIEVMPDHVHIFLKAQPIHAPHFIISQLKGYTSKILREEYPFLKRKLPSMWTRSYYLETIGHISQETIEKYIKDQKNK